MADLRRMIDRIFFTMKPVSLLKLNLLSCGALRKTDDDDNKLLLFGFLVARTGRGRQ